MFRRRTTALLTTGAIEVATLALIGLVDSFWAVLGLIVVWGLMYAAATPIRQKYLNGLIPSRQRATVLSFDSMMASLGGVGAQPALGRVADVWGYGSSYVASAGLTALSLPFVWLARRQRRERRGQQTGCEPSGRCSGHRHQVTSTTEDPTSCSAPGTSAATPRRREGVA